MHDKSGPPNRHDQLGCLYLTVLHGTCRVALRYTNNIIYTGLQKPIYTVLVQHNIMVFIVSCSLKGDKLIMSYYFLIMSSRTCKGVLRSQKCLLWLWRSSVSNQPGKIEGNEP